MFRIAMAFEWIGMIPRWHGQWIDLEYYDIHETVA
jgi:hypothetical protein